MLMTLKLGMQPLVLKYYKMCPNDDTGSPLINFTAMSDLVPFAYIWEKA